MKITVLGCGPSQGVPSALGDWGACDPADRRNHRRRPSILVDWDGFHILVDSSPDLRAQLIDAGIDRVDAVLYTHTHADHVHGIDDLRPIRRAMGRDIDAYGEPDVMDHIVRRFAYLFHGSGATGSTGELYRPILNPHRITGPFDVAGGARVVPFPQDHGICPSTGFRFGNFAYSTDVVTLPEEAFAALSGVEVWIVDCLRPGPHHPTHANLDTTLDWIARVKPRRAVLTHMNHQSDYEKLSAMLPDGVEPAYDGMVIDVADGGA